MAWYWILIIVLVSQSAFLLVAYLILRKNSASAIGMVSEANTAKTVRLEDELKASRITNDKMILELQRFAEENAKITTWYNDQKTLIAKEAQDEFQKLSLDQAAIDAKLNAIFNEQFKRTKPG
jgi:hypothetical protein